MKEVENGHLVLKSLPGDTRNQDVVNYLSGIFKTIPPRRISALVANTPVTLSKNVPEKIGKELARQLKKLGATAAFTPRQRNSPSQKPGKPPAEISDEAVTQAIRSCFNHSLPPIHTPFIYMAGLFLVAAGMVILTLLYMGLIGATIGFLVWYTAEYQSLFQSVDSPKSALFFLLAPLVIGCLMVFFMIKPLFVKRAETFWPTRLSRGYEPFLFEFVEKIARVMGTPAPKAIYVDTNVNAHAGFRRGFFSMFSHDLELNIGLPLLAGLNLNQLSGVIAHELGHFAQTTGMRLTYMIRTINFWFDRVVYEEDQWDERIRRWSKQWDFRVALVLIIARFFIWLTRKILWLFMWAGHIISCFMLRQMEYDADRHEMALVGSAVFISTEEKLVELNIANHGAFQDLKNTWKEKRLADNLPALILANQKQIPPDILEETLKGKLKESETALFDTHPSGGDRIRKAIKIKARPLFNTDTLPWDVQKAIRQKARKTAVFHEPVSVPATILLRDFNALARKITIHYYRKVLGERIPSSSLIRVDALMKNQKEESAHVDTLHRFFLGQFHVYRPLGIDKTNLKAPIDPKKACLELKRARLYIQKTADDYQTELHRYLQCRHRIIEMAKARILIQTGFTIDTHDFHILESTIEAVNHSYQKAASKQDRLAENMCHFEECNRSRIINANKLLGLPAIRSRLKDHPVKPKEMMQALAAAGAIETQFPVLDELGIASQQLTTLFHHLAGNEKHVKLIDQIKKKMRDIRTHLSGIHGNLSLINYPFEHADARVSLADYAIEKMPQPDELWLLMETANEAAARLYKTYTRLVGKAAETAEKVESALGLPPFSKPEQNDIGM
jgi:Zn-dependent protease with chaperone function